MKPESPRVLVVDDDERVLFVLSRALRKSEGGYHVETAHSAEEALEKARARAYDVVITDIVMSGMDGVELTEAIKNLYPDTVVIWVTAHGCYRFASDSEALGVYRCLEKPIRISEIRQAVTDASDHADRQRRKE